MKTYEALEVACDEFPNAITIREMPGNPNFLGWYLFSIDGKLCYVTPQGEVLTKEDEAIKNNQPDATVRLEHN